MSTTCDPKWAHTKHPLVLWIPAYVFVCAYFCACERRKERAIQRESKCLQDLMIECSTNMIVITRCLSLSGKGNLTRIITIPPPSVKGCRAACASKLISLSSCSVFLSQDKHMPEYDLLPCKSGCETLSSHPLVCFLVFDGMFVCPPGVGLFSVTQSCWEVCLCIYVTFIPIKMVSNSGWDHGWSHIIYVIKIGF